MTTNWGEGKIECSSLKLICGTSPINKLQWAIKVVETLRKLHFSILQAESTNIRFNGGGFEFVDRFRGNFSSSFRLAKISRKQPQISIVSTGFCLSTTQLCKDHSARKYSTMLGAN